MNFDLERTCLVEVPTDNFKTNLKDLEVELELDIHCEEIVSQRLLFFRTAMG